MRRSRLRLRSPSRPRGTPSPRRRSRASRPGDEHVAAVRLAPQDGREQPHHRRPADRRALVVPGAVAGDAHPRMAAALGIPSVDRRQAALVDQRLELGEAEALKLDRRAALGHGGDVGQSLAALRARNDGDRRRRWQHDRTAIVTGAGKRVGAEIARALLADGWTVVAHVQHDGDDRSPRARSRSSRTWPTGLRGAHLRRRRRAAAGAPAGQQCRALRLGRIRRVRRRANSTRTWRSMCARRCC